MTKYNGGQEVVNNTFVGRALMKLMGDKFEEIVPHIREQDSNIEVVITLNGVEVDAEKFFNGLKESIAFEVEDGVRKVIQEKVDEFCSKLTDISQRVEHVIQEEVDSIFPGKKWDEY